MATFDLCRHIDIDRIAGDSLLERQLQVIAKIRAPENLAPATPSAAENIAEYIAEYVAERFAAGSKTTSLIRFHAGI